MSTSRGTRGEYTGIDMYRTFILLFLYFKSSLSAPQQSGIETIADVKPTIFDYPAVVYDDVSQSYKQAAIINGGRQDSSSDDFSYDITTENIELETTEYTDDALRGYEPISDPVQPTDDYENEKKTTRFYSKIGYFLNPYLVEDNLNSLGKLPNVEIKQPDYEHSTAVPNDVVMPNKAKDKRNYPEDISNIKKENTYITEDKSNIDKSKPIVDEERKVSENETSVDEEKPNYILNNQNRVESNMDNKRNYAISKQSHFGGKKFGYTTVSHIQKTGKRKFRSNCRCEKIWNCPRLQISVPRCPNEYFMCCF